MAIRAGTQTREENRHWLPSQGVDPAPLTELNAECLGLLVMRAAESPVPRCCCRHCLPRCANSGLPCRLMRCAGWRRHRSPCLTPASVWPRAGWNCAHAGCTTRSDRGEPGYFEVAAARSITRRMLVYGWHLARSRPRAACLVFGSTLPVVESLAACSLAALEAAADRNADALRPRWAHQSGFWRELLAASSVGADTRLHELLLGGIQRLAADTLAAHAP